MIYCLFIMRTIDETPNKAEPTIEQVLTDASCIKEFVEINKATQWIEANQADHIIRAKVSDIVAEDIHDLVITDGITYRFGFSPFIHWGQMKRQRCMSIFYIINLNDNIQNENYRWYLLRCHRFSK